MKGAGAADPEDLADNLLKFVMSNGGSMRAFQEENATDDAAELQLLHVQYTDIVEELLDDFSDVQGCAPKQLSRACAVLAKKASRSAQKVSRYIAASSDFSVFRGMMAGGAGRRKSVVVAAQGGVDEERIRELLEKQMQGQQHDIHAMMALVQSLAKGGDGSALLEQQMNLLKSQQEQVLQERERLAAEIAKMQTMQGGGGGSSSSSKKDDVLDAAAAAAERQEDAVQELQALASDATSIASLPPHELAAKAQELGVTRRHDDDDEALRARLLEHVSQKSQQLSASVDAERARQDQAMQERMQRLKTEREAARCKLAAALTAAQSGDVTSAVAAAADAAAAAAAATGDVCAAPVVAAADSGETDEEKRQKLILQLQVRRRLVAARAALAPDHLQATMASLDSSVGLEKERQDAALQEVVFVTRNNNEMMSHGCMPRPHTPGLCRLCKSERLNALANKPPPPPPLLLLLPPPQRQSLPHPFALSQMPRTALLPLWLPLHRCQYSQKTKSA